MMLERVAVIVLNWNGKEDTLGCLETVLGNDHDNYFVIVSDNGSTDGSVEAVRKRYPQVVVVENGVNLGFAAGNNTGIEVAMAEGADVVVLLNNDTTVAHDWLTKMSSAAAALTPGSVLGAKIFYWNDPDRIWHFGFRWNRKKCRYVALGRGQFDEGLAEILAVDIVVGCCMWIPRTALDKVGLLEPDFFLNYEETDWCCRAVRAGIQIYSVPDAHVWHKISASFIGRPHHDYFMFRNRLLWLERNFSGMDHVYRYFRMAFRSHMKVRRKLIWQLVQYHAYNFIGRTPPHRLLHQISQCRAALRGVQDYYGRRFGNCPQDVLDLLPVAQDGDRVNKCNAE